MCGISGYFGKESSEPSKKHVHHTLKKMENRGKDGFGFDKVNLDNNKKLLFLHTRLSIIDPEIRSNQPLKDDEGMIVFNGMIYNFLEIRKKLIKKNIKFKTKSDTEVLLKFLNYYGIKKLNMLDGMWSFAYYNFLEKKLYLSRDRFGEKPLFFCKHRSNFIFGSYFDYILNLYNNKKFKLNFNKVENFIKNSWKSTNPDETYESYFKDIYAVKPGTYITINQNNVIKEKKYWNPLVFKKNSNLNYNKATKVLKKEYTDIIKKRLISDYPISCLLSGGIDSSSIVSVSKKFLNKKITCFSSDTADKNYDEKYLIKKTTDKYKLKSFFIKPKKNNQINLKKIKDIVYRTGNMLPTSTWLIYSYLNSEIKKKKFKVLLSGIGGDEFFSGYYIHHLHYLYSIKNKKKFLKKYDEWEKHVVPFIRSESLKNFEFYSNNHNKIGATFVDRIMIYKFFKSKKIHKFKNKIYFKDHHKNELYKDVMHHSLQGQLPYMDLVSMFHGIESRAPILSHKLYELAFSLPRDFLIKNGYGKAIFRDSLNDVVDSEILSEREKKGFYLDLNSFFNLKNDSLIKFIFKNNKINSILKVNEVRKMLNKPIKNNQENHLIFSIINSVFFLEKYKEYL